MTNVFNLRTNWNTSWRLQTMTVGFIWPIGLHMGLMLRWRNSFNVTLPVKYFQLLVNQRKTRTIRNENESEKGNNAKGNRKRNKECLFSSTISGENPINQICVVINFSYHLVIDWLNFNVLLLFAMSFNNVTDDWSCFSFSFLFLLWMQTDNLVVMPG